MTEDPAMDEFKVATTSMSDIFLNLSLGMMLLVQVLAINVSSNKAREFLTAVDLAQGAQHGAGGGEGMGERNLYVTMKRDGTFALQGDAVGGKTIEANGREDMKAILKKMAPAKVY